METEEVKKVHDRPDLLVSRQSHESAIDFSTIEGSEPRMVDTTRNIDIMILMENSPSSLRLQDGSMKTRTRA